jgi:X-linked retinitis pigmentosa GTPase regulator
LIKEIACGEEHSVFIAASGHLYSMGSNSEGRLGLADKSLRSSPSPCLVEGIANHRCVKVSCGWGHSAVVTEDGIVFTWGVGEFGALGIGTSENAWAPVKSLLPRSMRGLDVNCGSRHTALVVEENRNKIVLVCGSGEAGQLGTGKREKEFSFVAVHFNEDIQSVASGVFHTLALGSSGSVYATGGNSFGQLGLGNKKSSARFEKIQIDGYVVKISAGNHSGAVTDKGQLFIWGTGVFGEYLAPTRLSVGTVKDVSIGGSFGVALDSSGRLLSWGANSNGELGNGDFEPKIAPCPVSSLKGKTVRKVACGGNYVLALGLDLTHEKRDFSIDFELPRPVPKKPEMQKVEKYRTSSAEVQKHRSNDYDARSFALKQDETRAQQVENEKINFNYKILAQKLEDANLEIVRLNEKNSLARLDVQKVQFENEELKKQVRENASGGGFKLLVEETQRQNLILNQEIKNYREEVQRLKRNLDETRHSSKLEISHQFEELSVSLQQKHSQEMQELHHLLDQEMSKRKHSEIALKHLAQLENALALSNSECAEGKKILQEQHREFEVQKHSLQQEIEKYYQENNDLRRKLETAIHEKQRTELKMNSEISSYSSGCSELQQRLEKLSQEKEKAASLWKIESEKSQHELSDYRKRLELLTIEKEKAIKTLQTEIYNQGVKLDDLRIHIDSISSQNRELSEALHLKTNELKHYEEDLTSQKTEASYYKQANEDLRYQLSKFQKQGSDSVHKIDLMKSDMTELQESYKILLNENNVLKESIAELEAKNRQLFDNLEKELAQRAKEYKERTIQMLSTPNRSTSPYIRPTTPMTHTRDRSDDIGNTAAKLLDVMDSPKSVKTSQYLTVPHMQRGSTTPTKDEIQLKIASLNKNRNRMSAVERGLNYEY